MKILDFYADWCPPCKMMEPVIGELETEGVEVERINIDQNQDLADTYGVMSIPTFVIEDSSKEIFRFVGVTDKESIKKVMRG